MEFINYLIDISNQEYDKFEEFIHTLFDKLYVPVSQRHNPDFNRNNPNNSAYMEKVKKYTKFLIGSKIPENTPKYTI